MLFSSSAPGSVVTRGVSIWGVCWVAALIVACGAEGDLGGEQGEALEGEVPEVASSEDGFDLPRMPEPAEFENDLATDLEAVGEDPEADADPEVLKAQECDRSAYNCKLPAARQDRNRIFNRANNSYDWPIARNTPLLDGAGNVRGHVAPAAVKINYGARKAIGGVDHVYAFATQLDTGVAASGWVRETALVHGPIRRMPTVRGRNPGQGDYEAVWRVTGGDPAAFGELKVNEDFDEGGRKATDYLLRPGNVVNLLYNLPLSGGVSIDTYPAGVTFRRSRGVRQLYTDLYHPGGSTVVRRMPFIYGHIGGRYGWIARDALVRADSAGPGAEGPDSPDAPEAPPPAEEPAPPPPPPPPPAPVGQCYVRCCDGSLTGPISTPDAGSCHAASQPVCEARGYVRRSEFNGAQVYERENFCYAKCRNREAYHRVDGVNQDCAGHARDFCGVSGRGGLQDAMWSQCDP